MIISASRRTDIPAFYAEWFMNRVREGYFCRVNPFNSKQVSGFSLKPEDVDAICFWTKNPRPLIKHLDTQRHHARRRLQPREGQSQAAALEPAADPSQAIPNGLSIAAVSCGEDVGQQICHPGERDQTRQFRLEQEPVLVNWYPFRGGRRISAIDRQGLLVL